MRRALLIGLLFLTTTAWAQEGRPWDQLSPEEQQRAWQNYERYRRLPPGRQRFMERRYQQFRAMPPDEQQRLRQNYDRYRELPPGQRREFVEKYRKWKDRK
jgi:hypothetical protein